MTVDRRHFLRVAALAPLAAALPARAEPAACYDPATLPLSQKSRRRALEYVEASTDPARQCRLCAFYTAAAPGCGTCQILTGGTVNAGAVCSSFAPKAKT